MLNIKNSVFKERSVKKLIEKYMQPYQIKEVVSRNAVKLKLPASMRIYPVVNGSRIKRYRESVRRQRVEELKPVEVNGVEG